MIRDTESEPLHLQNLNPPQREAVEHVSGPILILAGAGSGKTRVLTRRIVHLISEHGVKPQRILAVTFTNKATEEMRERLRAMLGVGGVDPWVATFHSASLRILRRHAKLIGYSNDFTVYDTQDSLSVIKSLIKQLRIDDKQYPASLFQKAFDRAKNRGLTPEEYAQQLSQYDDSLVAEVYDKYQRELLSSSAMDFGDLLLNTVRLFEENPDTLGLYQHQLEHVLVDEFQDTNQIQYRLVQLLVNLRKNLLVVGDDDQSIYAFRGATIGNILNFEQDFPDAKVVKLEQNYRSTANILDAAHGVISKNADRKEKRLWTEAEQGPLLDIYCGYDESDEAEFVAKEIQDILESGTSADEISIFYRTNAQSRALEEALMDYSIPYRIYGGLKFYDRKEVKDVLGYLRLIANEVDNQAFLRVVNTPPRGIGAQSLQGVVQEAQRSSISLMEAARVVASANKNIRKFVTLMDLFRKEAEHCSVAELLSLVIEKSDYGPRLKGLADVTSQSRLENLQELVATAGGLLPEEGNAFEDLRSFLDRVSLTTSDERPSETSEQDEADDESRPKSISLMTLHLAKGLEFPYVFLTGMEEGLLPHYRSIDEQELVAEERRLCYVGITRAIHKLYLTRCITRGMFSSGGGFGFSGQLRKPSRFALDIPSSTISEREIAGREGSSFFSSLPDEPVYEFEEEYISEEGLSTPRKRSATKRKRSTGSVALVRSADSLSSRTDGLALVEVEQMSPGLKVVHPSFGPGVVRSLREGQNGDPGKLKVTVEFEEIESPKELLFKFAKLAVPNE